MASDQVTFDQMAPNGMIQDHFTKET